MLCYALEDVTTGEVHASLKVLDGVIFLTRGRLLRYSRKFIWRCARGSSELFIRHGGPSTSTDIDLRHTLQTTTTHRHMLVPPLSQNSLYPQSTSDSTTARTPLLRGSSLPAQAVRLWKNVYLHMRSDADMSCG